MAHEIAEIAGKSAMAYVNETPWHGLGTKVESMTDVPAALEAASLNWNVNLRPMYVRVGDKTIRVPRKVAVVRDVDSRVLSVVGGAYQPIQNADAFGVLTAACEQFGVTIETAGALGNGSRVWMLAKMPETASIEAVAGDRIDAYFLISNGHNGWTKYIAKPTPTRVVCANTLSAALTDGRERIVELRHTNNPTERLDVVAKMITEFIATMADTKKDYEKLAAKKMNLEGMRAYAHKVLNIVGTPTAVEAKKAAAIVDLFEHGKGVEFAPGTAWAAYNAVTEFTDHVRIGAKAETTLKAMNQSATFGPWAKMKVEALKLALAA